MEILSLKPQVKKKGKKKDKNENVSKLLMFVFLKDEVGAPERNN
jgi:hypothetical protein